jgi:hypothetical protein
MQYDAYQFVQSIKTRYWLGMLSAIDSALVAAARWPTTYQTQQQGQLRPGTEAEFMRFLMAAREYLLSEGRLRPEQMSVEHFLMLKPLCEHLVRTGRFPYARLRAFEGLDQWKVGMPPEPTDTDRERKDRA